MEILMLKNLFNELTNVNWMDIVSQHSIEDATQLFYDILLEKAPEGVIFILFTSYSFLPCHFLLALAISKLDLCEGGSFSIAIFNSDI